MMWLNKYIIFLTLLTGIGLVSLSGNLLANTKDDQRKVQKQIKNLSSQIGKQKKESSFLNKEVTRLEKELGGLTQKQHRTEQKIKDTHVRIADAELRRTELDRERIDQHRALAQQLQAMHTAGEQSHLRLLLLQDKPSDISRNIQYFNYLNQYRSEKIRELNEITEELKTVTETAKKDRQELKGLKQELSVQMASIEKKLVSREHTLDKVNSDLQGKRKRLNKLKDQEQALQREIDRIARAAAKKRAEEEAARERRRKAAEKKRQQAQARQQAARVNQQRQQQQRQQQQRQQQARRQQQAKKANQSKQQRRKQQPSGRQVATTRTPNKPFSKMRGKLSWPVNGRIIHKYHSRRNEKQRWKGVVIAAPGGSKVKAVAPGRVAFSGWMNGYGHLIIIEHDRNYMSLYGYNRAVFKRVGQRVRANETIAAVGNSSGQSRNALYFEIRRKTVPQNPARWLR